MGLNARDCGEPSPRKMSLGEQLIIHPQSVPISIQEEHGMIFQGVSPLMHTQAYLGFFQICRINFIREICLLIQLDLCAIVIDPDSIPPCLILLLAAGHCSGLLRNDSQKLFEVLSNDLRSNGLLDLALKVG